MDAWTRRWHYGVPPPTPAIHDLLPSSQFSLSPQQFSRNIYSRINKHKYSKPDAIGTRTVIRDYRNVSTETFRSRAKMFTVANFFTSVRHKCIQKYSDKNHVDEINRSLYCISISQGTSWRGNIFFKELPWRVRLSPGAQMPAQNSWLFLENAGAQNLRISEGESESLCLGLRLERGKREERSIVLTTRS